MHKYKFLLKDSNCRITQSDTLRWLLAAAPPPACCVWIPLLFRGICTCILEIRKYVSNLFMIWRVTLCCCVTYFFTYNIFPHLLLVSTFAPRPLFSAVPMARRGSGDKDRILDAARTTALTTLDPFLAEPPGGAQFLSLSLSHMTSILFGGTII